MKNDEILAQVISDKALQVSVVIIGRNEGDRLARCIESVKAADWQGQAFELIYVDSRSSDDSVVRAKALGAQAMVLDDASPCAAKARNLGWLAANAPFVLFLDGDTCLHPSFVQKALAVLKDPVLCAAWGHRRESHPHQSIYNRVMDLDWVYPVGRTLYFGGDVLVRRSALVAVGGYDPSLKAGEEPEMCARMRAEGWEIEHMDVPMTQHDLAITTFKAYWWRAFRSGIAYAEVAERMRLRGDPMWQHDAKRDFRHGLLFMLTPLFMWVHPWVTVTVVVAAGAVLARTARRCAWKAPGQTLLCWQYAVHVLFQKIPAFFGQMHWRRAQRQHKEVRMVEYKQADASNERS